VHSSSLRPRDPKVARRTLTALMVAGASALGARALIEPVATDAAARWTLGVGLVVVAGLLQLPPAWLDRLQLWSAVPLLGVLGWCGLALLTEDMSPGTHAFLSLPVIYAAAQLRARVAVVVTVSAILAEAAVFAGLQEPVDAAVDAAFTSIALVVVAWLLIRLVARQERLVAELEKLAAVDPLTGLVSRRVLVDALASAVSAGATDDGTALLLVDVDSFKTINDVYGHPVGDQALVHLASVLSSSVRSADAVLSRIGGDELAVLLPGCSTEAAVRRAEDLLTAVRTMPLRLPDGSELPMSVSIGVAHAPRHAVELESLYTVADEALYSAKRAGRDRFAVAEPVV
jgi:diguanylate cyclase (GGDEF)-like protein